MNSTASFFSARARVCQLLVVGWCACLATGWPPPATSAGRGAESDTSIRSFKARRDHGVVKQQYDWSCGAAAFATLLTHALNDPVTEADVLAAVFAPAGSDDDRVRKAQGLSLLDLQRVAQARGHRAQGFRIAADQLSRLKRAVIVQIHPFGYDHFAVLRGVRNERAILADPSLGNWRVPLPKFLEMWLDRSGTGVIFAVEPSNRQWPDDSPLGLADASIADPAALALRDRLVPLSVPARLRETGP